MRLRNLEKGIKLTGGHPDQNASFLSPSPPTSRSKQATTKRSKIGKASRKQPNQHTKQSSHTSRGQRSEHEFKQPLQQTLSPVSYNKDQAQTSSSLNRKRKKVDDEHRSEAESPKKARRSRGLREQLGYQEPQVAEQNNPESPLVSQGASKKRLENTLGSPQAQYQGQQSTHILDNQGNVSTLKNRISRWVDTGSWPNKVAKDPSDMVDEIQDFGAASATGGSTTAPSGATGKDTTPSKRKTNTELDYVENELALNGVYTKQDLSGLETPSKDFADKLLLGERKPTIFPCYPEEAVSEILDNLHAENETKLQMKVLPWVIPSVEDLALQNHIESGDFTDQFDREWQCTVLGRSKPKPDYAVGVSSLIFSRPELSNLNNYGTRDTPFHLTPRLRFPFLMGEAKMGHASLANADRQNVHSAALAIRAMIKLYEAAFGPNTKEVKELFGKVLVFTISHNDTRADIYGHFATCNPPSTELNKRLKLTSINKGCGNQVDAGRVQSEAPRPTDSNKRPINRDDAGTAQAQADDNVRPVTKGAVQVYYYRYLMATYDFRAHDGALRFKPYNFVFNVYETFGPEHIKRILKAASVLKMPKKAAPRSARSAVTVFELNPNDSVSAAPNRTALELQVQLDNLTALLEQQRLDSRRREDMLQEQNAKLQDQLAKLMDKLLQQSDR